MITYFFEIIIIFIVFRIVSVFISIKKSKNTKIIKGAEGFEYKKGKTGILLIHGFTSSAWDHRALGEYLAKKDITVIAPLVKGHGTCPENLASTDKDQWLKSVEESLKKLKKITEKQIVAGDSFGGNLALLLASRYKVDGIITMGTPIFFKNERFLKSILPVVRLVKSYQKKWYHNELPEDIRKERLTYKKIPLNAISEVRYLINLSKESLSKITAPILIMQSTTDFGVGEQSVHFINDNVSSKKKKVSWVKDAYHVFIIDKNKEKSFKTIYSFIKEINDN